MLQNRIWKLPNDDLWKNKISRIKIENCLSRFLVYNDVRRILFGTHGNIKAKKPMKISIKTSKDKISIKRTYYCTYVTHVLKIRGLLLLILRLKVG